MIKGKHYISSFLKKNIIYFIVVNYNYIMHNLKEAKKTIYFVSTSLIIYWYQGWQTKNPPQTPTQVFWVLPKLKNPQGFGFLGVF